MEGFNLAVTSCLFLIVEGWSAAYQPNFRFASYYGDHMVLQKAPKRATIWGYSATVNEILSVQLNGILVGMTVSRPDHLIDNSVWSITLPPTEAGGPHHISVTSGQGEITLKDVLFGDVWLCSGQSNMQFTLDMVFNASDELADASRYPNIRVFTAGRGGSLTPQYDLLYVAEKWSIPNNASLGNGPWSYFSAVCWLFGKYLSATLGYPVGLIDSSYGGTPIEAWSSIAALEQCSSNHHTPRSHTAPDPKLPTVLWNAMIRPLINMTIYGAIWYQGESNALPGTDTNLYSCRFQAMIRDWRTQFSYGQSSEQFPFGFVQLAPWRNTSITTGFPDIRWHQTADYGYVPNYLLPNVFMAVAMDLPDFSSPYQSIHPRDKQDVSKRLHTEALAVAYNASELKKLRSPYPSAINYGTRKPKTAVIMFDRQIEVRSDHGIEACCIQTPATNVRGYCSLSANVWQPSGIISSDTTSITIDYSTACPSRDKPSLGAIRYAWRESPCPFKKCAVDNLHSGYPSPPFIFYVV